MDVRCAVLCLIVGTAGLILFVVGFALPYWLIDELTDEDTASHGLWQSRMCQGGACTLETISFGVSAEFEAGRVFSCATIVMGVISFFFTIFLLSRSHRVWAIRSSAVWFCTGVFNILVCGLIAGSEEKTLRELNLPGVSADEGIGGRIGWSYWMTVASMCLFILTAISCAIISCTEVSDDDDDKSDAPLTRRNKKKQDRADRIRETKSLRTPPEQLNSIQNGVFYPKPNDKMNDYVPFVKTPGIFPSIPRSTNEPSIYSVNKTDDGYSIYPSRAAANIDNHRMRLNALDVPHYTGASSDYGTSDRVMLNRSSYTPSTSSGPVTTLSIPKSGQPNGESTYSLNVTPRGLYPNLNNNNSSGRQLVDTQGADSALVNTTQTFTVSTDNAAPTYSTLPRPSDPAGDGEAIAVLRSSDSSTMVTTALIS